MASLRGTIGTSGFHVTAVEEEREGDEPVTQGSMKALLDEVRYVFGEDPAPVADVVDYITECLAQAEAAAKDAATQARIRALPVIEAGARGITQAQLDEIIAAKREAQAELHLVKGICEAQLVALDKIEKRRRETHKLLLDIDRVLTLALDLPLIEET